MGVSTYSNKDSRDVEAPTEQSASMKLRAKWQETEMRQLDDSKWFAFFIEPFLHQEMTYEHVWQTTIFVQILFVVPLFALIGAAISMPQIIDCDVGLTGLTSGGEACAQHFTQVVLNLALVVLCIAAMVFVFYVGATTRLKVLVLGFGLLWCITSSIVWRSAPFQLLLIPLVATAHVLQTSEDTNVMDLLGAVLVGGQLVFLGVYLYIDLSDGDLVKSWHDNEKTNWFGFVTSAMIPPVMNHLVLRSFLKSSKAETAWINEALDEAHKAAELLANFDLDKAEQVLSGSSRSTSALSSSSTSSTSQVTGHVTEPLRRLLSNLRSYKVFLPQALFAEDSAILPDPPNEELPTAMLGLQTDWEALENCLDRLREPSYSLKAFELDMVTAFPELTLYRWKSGYMSSGLDGDEEFQRTMGALFAVYALCRLDIDGKEVFSYGVQEDGKPCGTPDVNSHGEAAIKLNTFYQGMAWDRTQALMARANIFETRNEKLRLHKDRTKVLLVLTAIHDVMKNSVLLPIVQVRHKEYMGYHTGDTIYDHDVALAYVLEHFPHLLPSYHGLEPSLRAPILFTQGKMGFNNGWLVQGEAPPGALFKTFKKIIIQGHASTADVNLYFVHWLTDLAGAEVYGDRPWPGSEKFTKKFPVKVLGAFLDSFSHVDGLATSSEVEVMESYLESRWDALGSPAPQISEDSIPAAMRLSLMAQGFERDAISELDKLPEAERQTLITELARTGCREQFRSTVSDMTQMLQLGPSLLVYYAPALLQKAKAKECGESLRVLAKVMRAARILFPPHAANTEDFVTIRIDALKVHTPQEIKEKGEWHLRRMGPTEAEVGLGWASSLVDDETSKSNLQRWGSKISLRSGEDLCFSHGRGDAFAAADIDVGCDLPSTDLDVWV